MPFDFSIKIVGSPGEAAEFVPQDGNAGDPLNVQANDIVSFGNSTVETHQPWPTDDQHNLLPAPPDPPLAGGPIPPGQSSSPAWVVASPAGLIHYRCAVHTDRDEFGTILVS